ncbi:cysteine proteinase [Annulohypoxylon moriforme]|nr:cysteine proteinase [Annulohypoxylon moriforme]
MAFATENRRRADRPKRSVTFQLPGIPHPVTPRDPVIGRTRKRRYSPTEDRDYSESYNDSDSYSSSPFCNIPDDDLDEPIAEESIVTEQPLTSAPSPFPRGSASLFQRSPLHRPQLYQPSWPRALPFAEALGLNQPGFLRRPSFNLPYQPARPPALSNPHRPVSSLPANHSGHGRSTRPTTLLGRRHPELPFHTPERINPLSPDTRRYLQRPIASPPVAPLPVVPLAVAPGPVVPGPVERVVDSMPGAWPSELDGDDSAEAHSNNSMAFPTRFGANIYNAVTYLRDSSYSLCVTLGNRILHSPRQASVPATISIPEDGGRALKRRRVGFEDLPGTPETEEQATPTFVDDPMDIDTPSPTNINMRDVKVETSSEDMIDIEKQYADLETSPSVSPILSPNSSAASAAARRAANLFPNGKKFSPKQTQTQVKTPPPEGLEKPKRIEHVPEKKWKPLPPPKYSNILEFFEHDDEICLPGLERLRLTPKTTKIFELDTQREERLRIEKEKAERERQERLRKEEERLNESLRPLGLRRARSLLITPLSYDWEQRARASPMNGRTEQHKWQGARHRDGVELTPHDFGRLVPSNEWLNDNDIQAALVHLATYINDKAGVRPKADAPKCVALSSQYWSNFRAEPRKNIYPRGLDRNWGMKPANFLNIETVLIPVNQGNHWTVLVIRPTRRTVAYVDSFHSLGPQHLADAKAWLETFLGDKFKADEWHTEQYQVPYQTNGYDCGMFVITNSIYLSLGIDPSGYSQEDMPLQRLRIAAVLLNGGFTGPFDLSHL